jgi:hypothetical protein
VIRRLRSLTLLTLAAALAAEEPAPVPAPDPTPITTTEAAPAPTQGGADPKGADVAAAPRDVTGFNGRASARQNPFFASLTLGGGFDSNSLLLEEASGPIDRLSGAAYQGALVAGWRLLRSQEHHLTLVADTEYERHPDQSEADLWQYGGLLTYGTTWGGFIPGLTAGAHRYVLDGDAIATSYAASVSLNRATRTWASLPAIEVLHITYDDFDSASGTLVDGYYRHWFMLEPGNPRRRLELGIRVGRFAADSDSESYLTIRPSATLLWRVGTARTPGCWELAGRAGYEYRAYSEAAGGQADAETSHTLSAGADADRWLNRWLSAGGYLRGAVRASDADGRDYDRVQAGLRLTATY